MSPGLSLLWGQIRESASAPGPGASRYAIWWIHGGHLLCIDGRNQRVNDQFQYSPKGEMTVNTNQTARLAGSDESRDGSNYEGAMLTNQQRHYKPLFVGCTLQFSAFWNFDQSALQISRARLPGFRVVWYYAFARWRWPAFA